MQHLKMNELPKSERPYEKFSCYGEEALSDEELLTIILRSGCGRKRANEIARDVLNLCDEYGGLAYLSRIPMNGLLRIKGIGYVKAIQIKCIFEISKRIFIKGKAIELKCFESAMEVASFMKPQLFSLEHEEVWILFLDGHNNLIKKSCMTRGTSNSSIVSIRDIYKEALRIGAVHIIMVHNHPSGNPEPSHEDISITEQMKRAGDYLDITLLDHVIIGGDSFVSLNQRGFLTERSAHFE